LLAPLILQSSKIDNFSIDLSWSISQGATNFSLKYTYLNSTLIASYPLGNVNTTKITGLQPSIEYIFTIYSGNSNGFDFSEGKSLVVSTDSNFILFFFFSSFFFLLFF